MIRPRGEILLQLGELVRAPGDGGRLAHQQARFEIGFDKVGRRRQDISVEIAELLVGAVHLAAEADLVDRISGDRAGDADHSGEDEGTFLTECTDRHG